MMMSIQPALKQSYQLRKEAHPLATIEILWIDDDSPHKVEGYEGVRVLTAQSCGQAEELLNTRSEPPQWAVVDLIVPQGDWGDGLYAVPGLNYIEHLKTKYGERIRILAFSIALTNEVKKKAIDAGAIDALAKQMLSWSEVVRIIKAK